MQVAAGGRPHAPGQRYAPNMHAARATSAGKVDTLTWYGQGGGWEGNHLHCKCSYPPVAWEKGIGKVISIVIISMVI